MLDNMLYRRWLTKVVSHVPLEDIRNSSVVVTGASGLIGSAVVDLLLHINEINGANISVCAVGRDMSRLQKRFGVRAGLSLLSYNDLLTGVGALNYDYAIFAASPASPDLYLADPAAVLRVNVEDVCAIINRLNKSCLRRVLYVSSSEVYGDISPQQGGHNEDRLGKIDETNVRTCYALAKRRAEEMCIGLLPDKIVIARPGHIYGPTATRSDRRVSSCWAYDVAMGRDIIMKSDGMQLRSYTHAFDCASALLTALSRGKPGEAYNIANHRSVITIRRLAEILTGAAGTKLRFMAPSVSEQAAFNPMSDSSLNASKLEGLGWCGEILPETGLAMTVEILREVYNG